MNLVPPETSCHSLARTAGGMCLRMIDLSLVELREALLCLSHRKSSSSSSHCSWVMDLWRVRKTSNSRKLPRAKKWKNDFEIKLILVIPTRNTISSTFKCGSYLCRDKVLGFLLIGMCIIGRYHTIGFLTRHHSA